MWSRNPRERIVELNVYQFTQVGERTNGLLSSVRLGVFHTGVVVDNYEYSFNDQGIFRTRPRAIESEKCDYKETIRIGSYIGTANEFRGLLNELHVDFPKGTYDLMTRNCNHFSDAFSFKLTGIHIPSHLNRIASLGASLFGSSVTKAYQISSSSNGSSNFSDDSFDKSNRPNEEESTRTPSFWSSLFSLTTSSSPSDSSNAVAPSTSSSSAAADKRKKKELTPQQQALLAIVRGGSVR